MTLKKSKQPVQPLPGIEPLDDVARRYFSQKERESMDTEDFGDPEKRAFPVNTQEDLDNAAHLVGHADNPDAVKTRLKAIAERKGLSLPKSWQDASARAEQPENHAEDHSETDATIERSMPASDVSYYAPITRINQEKREVIGVATAEVKDAYRTVIGYEASKDAFQRWRGNIREMHQSKAVGRALEIMPDDEHRRIIVRARISKGAEDTWQKILDGTLTGFSIGGKNGKWTTRTIDGEDLPYLERYDQAELSVVDNPACPASSIEVVRADGLASDVLAPDDELEPTKPATPPAEASVERAGARLSKETMDALHQARDHAMNSAKSTMQTCNCDDCAGMMNRIAEHDDNDGDVDANELAPATMRKLVADIVREVVTEAVQAQIAPTMQRVNALLAADASRTETPDMTRRVDGIDEQLSDIKELVEKIAAQPVDGGPLLHGALPMEKRLATQQGGNASRSTDADAIARAMELGFAPPSDPQEAIRAAAKLFKPIPR